MTMHEEWTDKLSDYLDGELPDAERRQVTAHLADLRRLQPDPGRAPRSRGGRARRAAARTVDRDLWAGIAERIASPEGSRPVVLSGPCRRFSFSLAAAGRRQRAPRDGFRLGGDSLHAARGQSAARPPLSLAPAARRPSDVVPTTFSSTDAGYDAAVADLERALGNSGRASTRTPSKSSKTTWPSSIAPSAKRVRRSTRIPATDI